MPPKFYTFMISAGVLFLRGLMSVTTAVDVPSNERADQLRANEQKQEELRGNVQQLGQVLATVLDEYARNQLAGDDQASVERVRTALSDLSTEQMRAIIDLLQRARAIAEPGASARVVADAHSAQKQVVVAIQRILAEHARAQETRELARHIHELADRQARNFRSGIELARMASGAKPENFEAVLQAQLEVQRGEQHAIASEIKLAALRVQKSAATAHANEAERLAANLHRMQQIQPRAEAAESSLATGEFVRALAEEKATRDELRKIAQAIAPRARGVEALREAERELAHIIREQEGLKSATGQQQAETDYHRWIQQRLDDIDPNRTMEGQFRRMTPQQRRQNPELRARFDAEQAAKGTRLAQMGDEQGELAGKTDHFAQGLPEVAPVAASLEQASQSMQAATQAMAQADALRAEQQQASALQLMRDAQEALRKKTDEAELLAGDSGDRVRDLERLRAAVENLAAEEEAISRTGRPDPANQREIARRATQLAQRSASLAPAATPALQQGAVEAGKAAEAINPTQNEPARRAAGAAAGQLKQAAAQIASELAKAQEAAEQRERTKAALAELAKLIEAQQKLDLDTAAAMATGTPGKLKALTPAQTKIQARTTTFKASLSGEMIAAVQALNDAENAMQVARETLEKEEGAGSRVAQGDAIARLFDAQKAIQSAAKAAAEKSGEQFSDAAAMAEAANRMSQAMQEVNEAQSHLGQAAEMSGRKAAQDAAEAAARAAIAAGEAAQSAQATQQQANQTGNQAALRPAAVSQQRAEDAMKAALQAQQFAQKMQNLSGASAKEAAREAARHAGQAAESAAHAGNAARQAQRAADSAGPTNQAASAQAGNASQSAQTAVQAARQAQQLATMAAQAAEAGGKAAQQSAEQAASQLAQAAMQATQAATQQAGSPRMQESMQAAARQLASAAAQAMQGQSASAQKDAQEAAQQLAKASAMAEGLQAGIGQPSAGQLPGQGQQGQMQGQGMQGAGRQPGQGQGSGPTKDTDQPSEGATGYQAGSPEAVQRAARQAALKNAGFLGLPPRERAAIQQSIGEKYPAEFGPLVEQYLLNLANEPARK